VLLHRGFAKLFSKASIKPRHRSGATVHFLCQAFFFAKESGLPVTVAGYWVLPLSYCACAPGASAVGTLSGRSRLIARPPLILATFVASALLAWKCSQSTFACGLRARRQPPRTRALNVPRRASTNIGNRAMFYTLIEMFVYKLMLPFHKIWDITNLFQNQYIDLPCESIATTSGSSFNSSL